MGIISPLGWDRINWSAKTPWNLRLVWVTLGRGTGSFFFSRQILINFEYSRSANIVEVSKGNFENFWNFIFLDTFKYPEVIALSMCQSRFQFIIQTCFNFMFLCTYVFLNPLNSLILSTLLIEPLICKRYFRSGQIFIWISRILFQGLAIWITEVLLSFNKSVKCTLDNSK